MTQNQGDPLLEHFESALSRAAITGDACRVQALRDVLGKLSEDATEPSRLAGYRAVLDLLQGPEMVQTPRAWLDEAMDRIRELDRSSSPRTTWAARAKDAVISATQSLESIWATLVLDSHGTALPGIRGNTTMQPRQLMYEFPSGTIHLQIEERTDRSFDVLGQFISAEGVSEGSIKVSLLSGETTTANETGEFRFEAVPSGDLYLRFQSGESVVQLEPIHLASSEE